MPLIIAFFIVSYNPSKSWAPTKSFFFCRFSLSVGYSIQTTYKTKSKVRRSPWALASVQPTGSLCLPPRLSTHIHYFDATIDVPWSHQSKFHLVVYPCLNWESQELPTPPSHPSSPGLSSLHVSHGTFSVTVFLSWKHWLCLIHRVFLVAKTVPGTW